MNDRTSEEKLEHLGVAIVVLNSESNKVLLGERLNSYKSDWFGLPGGRLELREKLMDCVQRELNEEVGITPNTIEYVGVVRKLQNNSYNFIHFGLVAKSFTGKVQNLEPHKCKGWKWVSIENLPDKILPAHKILIKMYLQPSLGKYRNLL